MDTIILKDVTKTFGDLTAVDNLTLNVPAGSIYGFIGPNGSGKTTTLRMIMNIFYPDSGSITVLGESLTGSCVDRIGYMPEERGLYTRMKVHDLLCFYGDLKNGENVKSEVDNWLERFDLADWRDKKVETLSKGMSQKVQFIATVVARPEVIILDEPFSGLDPVNAEALIDAVLDLQKSGSTIIFSTHDMDVAEKMCDYIFMIFKGKKVLDGTLESIQDKYGSDTLRIRCDAEAEVLHNIDGVEKIRDFGKSKELRITQGHDSQKLLADIIDITNIWSFDLVKPSLEDIFIRIAGPEAKEATNV